VTIDRRSRIPLVDVLHRLRAHRVELQRLGVRHAAIFGSLARGEDRPDSDADILVEIDREVIRDLFDSVERAAPCRRYIGVPNGGVRPSLIPAAVSDGRGDGVRPWTAM
jgi:predicted nucleotidyltransferase